MASATSKGLRLAWLCVAACGPAGAVAATIYGSLSEAGKPVAGADMVLQCGAEGTPGKTDARGAFRFTVNKTGNCELRVAGAVAPVIVYDEPTRYDYEVRRAGNASSLVRR